MSIFSLNNICELPPPIINQDTFKESNDDLDFSEKETNELGISGYFMGTVSANKNWQTAKGNEEEDIDHQQSNTKAHFLEQQVSQHGNKPRPIKSWL